MALLKRLPPEYFLKYKEKPVKLKPYSEIQRQIATIYIKKVTETLKDFKIKTMIRGSTAFKILGKGDIEIGVYPQEIDWDKVVEILGKEFGEPGNVEEDYVRFNDVYKETEIEIIVLKGGEALQDIKLHNYLLGNPDLLKKYEEIKKKYAFSKREYQIQKNKFLTNVLSKIYK